MKIGTLTFGVALLAGRLMLAQGIPPVQQAPAQPGTISPAQNERVSRLAARMIMETDMARKAIAANNRTQADQHINNALNLAQQIKRLEPNKNIIPIYAELESKSVLQPVLEARGQMQGAPRTDESQAQSPAQGVVVERTRGQFTFIGIDTANSVKQLEAAKAALDNNNPVAADDALRAVEDNVITAQVSKDMPLLRARQNLALAETYAKQGRTRDASAALNAAASGLASYASSGGTYAAEARTLEQQVRSYSQTVAQQSPQQAAAQIGSYWNETTSWFRQA
jgi:hypothetical protein